MVTGQDFLKFNAVFYQRNDVRYVLTLKKREDIFWIKTTVETDNGNFYIQVRHDLQEYPNVLNLGYAYLRGKNCGAQPLEACY